jgi:predicted dehydrogenase
MTPDRSSRRDFLKTTAALAATAASLGTVPLVHAGGNDEIRVGLIGCGSPRGGRGRGAAHNCTEAAPNVKLVALADLFPDHLEYSKTQLKKDLGDKFAVKDDWCFTGWDAYQKLLDLKEVNLVILATPPGFRPLHIKAAVEAGKNVFAEKPVATDAFGVRSVMESCEKAKQKGLAVVSGLCWRYHPAMRETIQQVHDGKVGDILTLQCTYHTGELWSYDRKPEWSDVEWQVRNWIYFTWLSGDHNVEQHIHSLDKMAWAMQDEYPVKAVGTGGRQVRTDERYGNIFDHHAVVYEYKNGQKLFASTRQQNNCAPDISDNVWGTKGVCHINASKASGSVKPHGGGDEWKSQATDKNMYVVEHEELINSIRNGKPINNGDYMCKSTMMAIMGRMATYTGQVITWDMALNSKEKLMPDKVEFGKLDVPAVAKPGVTKYV